MASKVVRGGAGPRFVAEVPGLPGVIAIGETAWQAQMRAAVVALRAIVFDGASERAGTTLAATALNEVPRSHLEGLAMCSLWVRFLRLRRRR